MELIRGDYCQIFLCQMEVNACVFDGGGYKLTEVGRYFIWLFDEAGEEYSIDGLADEDIRFHIISYNLL